MAASLVQTIVPIPGLTAPLEYEHLQATHDLYNALPHVEVQPNVTEQQLQTIAEIFVKHNLQDKLGVHLIHRHDLLGSGLVMAVTNIAEPAVCWNRPTKMSNVDLTQIHGHIFKYVGAGCFLAYEYEPGSVTDLSSVSENFFKDLIDCLCTLGLQDVLGLQVLGESTDTMVEFDLTQLGTVMMREQDAQHGESFRTTGWTFHRSDDGMVS